MRLIIRGRKGRRRRAKDLAVILYLKLKRFFRISISDNIGICEFRNKFDLPMIDKEPNISTHRGLIINFMQIKAYTLPASFIELTRKPI